MSSPLLVIFMCTLASFSVLFGEMKRKVLLGNIVFCSFLAVIMQAMYISLINKMIFSFSTFLLPYITLIIFSTIPVLLIKYETPVSKAINRLKNEIKL